MTVAFHHVPILADACLEQLDVKPGGLYVDATLGGGGHSELILKACWPDGRLIGIDRDQDARAAAAARLAPFGDRLEVKAGNFHHICQLLEGRKVDGILADLGVSSFQLDEPSRGFSYQHDAPLDMRMDQSQPFSAYELVNEWSREEIFRAIKDYGEERFAGRIADNIVKKRQRAAIRTTGELVDIITASIPAANRRTGPHPAKRTFQGLRIAVNDELAPLEQALRDMVDCLKTGGRVAVITFHSLEDRIVKQTFKNMEDPCTCPRDFPVCVCGKKPLVKVLTHKAVEPGQDEVEFNPRARSARLRAAQRVLTQ